MENIKSITEAFSMQPESLCVGRNINNTKVDKITLEQISHLIGGESIEFNYYVGRDIDGNKLFQFRADTVNVFFF